MVVNKRKKSTKQRAGTTHGYGSMKKNRGAGHRGGRGNAGSGKRGDSKKPSTGWNKKYFGKSGFKSKVKKDKIKIINIIDLEQGLQKFLDKKLIVKEGDSYRIDITKLGYNKLLSKGKVLNKWIITVPYASTKSIEKIKSAGGDIEVLNQAEADKTQKE